MIVKNESASIGRCLNSVQNIVDEIIIVDTGSTDDTKEIVSKFTQQIYDFPWVDNFAAARNFSFSKAKSAFILWLDADDEILQRDQEKFIDLKASVDETVDSVTMNYNLTFDKYRNVTSSLRRNRLVKRVNNFQWIGAVHEYLEVSGKIIDSEVSITHDKIKIYDSNRNLQIYENRLAKGEKFSPRDLFYYANELNDHRKFKKAISFYQKFLATRQGWVEDNLAACGKISDCYRELGNSQNALKYVLRSFKYDTPRAEFCCRLGWHYMQEEKYKQAVFWYKLATDLEKPLNWGVINNSCWTWLPHLQLCVCYDRLGRHELAYKHNELAAEFIPDDHMIIYNRNYLKTVLK